MQNKNGHLPISGQFQTTIHVFSTIFQQTC